MPTPPPAPGSTPGSTPEIDLTGRSADVDRLRVVLLQLSRRIRANSVGELPPSQFSLFVAVNTHGPDRLLTGDQ